MKIKLLILFVLLCNLLIAVNGELTVEEDRMFLRVWGTHSERGEAQGFLLADKMMELMNNYIVQFTFSGNAIFYNQATQIVNSNFQYEEKYLEEMEGILTGLENSGTSLFVSQLDRNINLNDLKLVNAIIDLPAFLTRNPDFQGSFGCSSLVSWGESTQNDSDLNGEIVISRLLDWSTNQALRDNSLMIIHEPSEENEQKWVSFTYPCLIGGLTGFNYSRVFTELNMGNSSGSGAAPYHPILLDVRSGLEESDYNDDGNSNKEDIISSIEDNSHCNGFIVMTANSTIESNPVSYVEVNASGTEVRNIEDNTELHGNNIASTNHFRKLQNPIYCSRYANLIDMTNVDSLLTIESNYSTLIDAAGIPSNMMAIQYIPSLNQVKWSTYDSSPAYQEELITYDISGLFSGTITTEIDNAESANLTNLKNYPNPFNPTTEISFSLPTDTKMDLSIYNAKGQKIKTLKRGHFEKGKYRIVWDGKNKSGNEVASGVYFSRITSPAFKETKKMVLMK